MKESEITKNTSDELKSSLLDIADLVIIGSGPAGLTSAIYAGRSNLNPIVLAGNEPGGQLMNTTKVENYPGFTEGIDGPELMNQMLNQAERYGAKLIYKNAIEVDISNDIKTIRTETNDEYLTKSIIIATGATPRRLGLENEEKFWGRGVSTCATCDGPLYKDKTVAIIGGGDSAMEEASYLSKFAEKVYIIHRGEEFKASKIMQERVLENDKVEIIWNSEVEDINGDEYVTGLEIINNKTENKSDLIIDGMFLAIGNTPNTEFLENQIELDKDGYVKSVDGISTSVEGIFVAGDIVDPKYKQAIAAAGVGAKAAIDVETWLSS